MIEKTVWTVNARSFEDGQQLQFLFDTQQAATMFSQEARRYVKIVDIYEQGIVNYYIAMELAKETYDSGIEQRGKEQS